MLTETLESVRGMRIERMKIDEERGYGDGVLCIYLPGNRLLTVRDDGRRCCEARYLTCDDDLEAFAGATLQNIEIREGPGAEEREFDFHEMAFVHVITDKGTVVLTTHNEHNGYYGGFALVVELEDC